MKTIILKNIIAILFVLSISVISIGQQNISSLKFDGTNDYVSYSTDVLENASNYTIEAWVLLPSGANTGGRIVQRFGCYQFYYGTSNNKLSFGLYQASTSSWYYYHSSNGSLPADDEWHHVAVVRSTSGTSTLKLYIDGVDETSTSYSGKRLRNISGRNLYIGNDGSGGHYFEGKIDEVRLKNVAESIGDLNTDKNDAPYAYDGDTEALFHFDENTGGTTANEAGGSATLNGVTWASIGDLWFPIKLSSFIASIDNKNISLDWTTLSETNNKGFEIQRSSDATKWDVLGFVEGQGNSRGEVNYTFLDKKPKSTNYYRLNQIDFDGNNTYSDVLSVMIHNENKVSIYPNPTNGFVNIVGVNTNTHYLIYNKLGKMVSQGNTDGKIDISNLNSGVYYLKINRNLQTFKFVVK